MKVITHRLLVLLALTCALPASAAVTLNLQDAELSSLTSTVSEVTGKNFIVDPRVKGKVTVVSSRPMSPEAVYETFLAVLQVQGFAAVPAGAAIKLVPEGNARTDGGVPNGDGAGKPIDDVVTHVFQPQNISATQLVPILRPLMPQWAHLAAYAGSNMLILSDRAANIVRLEELIQQMDQSSDRNIDVVNLQNASASEIVRTVTAINAQDKAADPGSRAALAIADERTNRVLLAGDRADHQRLMALITSLDVPQKEGGGTQVIYLRYASAENLAPILQGYAQQVSQPKAGTSTATAAAPAPASTGGSNAEGALILADKDTNALVVTASPKAMRQIRDVIAQLDIQRAQVLVEAIIAEVSADRSIQLGVDWAIFNKNQIASANINNQSTLTALGTALASTAANPYLGLISQGANIAGGKINENGTSFAVLVKALKGDGDSNLLSTPTLVTLDNQEAKFSAGQEVPFLTGQFTNTGGSSNVSNPFQTIQRKDVGLTLGVTPQINEGNHVKIKLNLEVSSLASGITGASDLITNKRTLGNTVAVQDGQILVIGGLIDDNMTGSKSGVPWLSEIPLLGHLFKSETVSKKKRNLMLFIRPTVLRKAEETDYYSRRKYEAVRQAQIDAGRELSPWISGSKPLLAPYEGKRADDPRAQAEANAKASSPTAADDLIGLPPR